VSWTALVPDVTPLRGPGARGFRAIFTSRTVAYLGSQAAEVALLVQAQRITGSPLVVGTLGLAELVPLVVFGLYGGVLADRFDRRALMRWCEAGLGACAVLLLLNSLLPHPLLWPLYVIAGLMMAFASLQRPGIWRNCVRRRSGRRRRGAPRLPALHRSRGRARRAGRRLAQGRAAPEGC
jgi:MFS family permease